MAREFPDGFEDILTDLNRACEGADAPEDQTTVGRMASFSHKKTQVFTPLAVIVILMGIAWPSTGNTRSGQAARESGAFSRRSSTGQRAGLIRARSTRPVKPAISLC